MIILREAKDGIFARDDLNNPMYSRRKSPLPAQRAFSQEEGGRSVFTSVIALGLFCVRFLLNKLNQTGDQPASAADHVQPALMLMLLKDVIDFVLQF